MRLKAIKEAADKLIREMGTGASEAAALETLKAKRQKNVRLEMFRAQVVLEIARQIKSKLTSKAE